MSQRVDLILTKPYLDIVFKGENHDAQPFSRGDRIGAATCLGLHVVADGIASAKVQRRRPERMYTVAGTSAYSGGRPVSPKAARVSGIRTVRLRRRPSSRQCQSLGEPSVDLRERRACLHTIDENFY
jgi:hypothetical protein